MSRSTIDSATLTRIARLVALASSPNENEARTSAFLACKMMREHGLDVSAQASGPSVAAHAELISELRQTQETAARATRTAAAYQRELAKACADLNDAERSEADVVKMLTRRNVDLAQAREENEALRARIVALETAAATGPKSDAKTAWDAPAATAAAAPANAPSAVAAETLRKLRAMSAKFAGKCSCCGERIYAGEPIMWGKGVGTFHAECAIQSASAA